MLSALNILKAYKRIKNYVNETPLEYSRYYSNECGGDIYFKCEHFQITGAFKTRGAMYALMNLPAREKKKGIMA